MPVKQDPYDILPYPCFPYPQTHPNRLAVMGILHGMSPASVESCRVLEIGCSEGANLIPMAYAIPGSEFVGFDRPARPSSGRASNSLAGPQEHPASSLPICSASAANWASSTTSSPTDSMRGFPNRCATAYSPCARTARASRHCLRQLQHHARGPSARHASRDDAAPRQRGLRTSPSARPKRSISCIGSPRRGRKTIRTACSSNVSCNAWINASPEARITTK